MVFPDNFPSERRRHPRQRRRASAWIYRESAPDQIFRAPLANLSVGGALLTSPFFPGPDEPLRMRIDFPNGAEVFVRAAVARRTRCGFACRFTEVESSGAQTLAYYLESADTAVMGLVGAEHPCSSAHGAQRLEQVATGEQPILDEVVRARTREVGEDPS